MDPVRKQEGQDGSRREHDRVSAGARASATMNGWGLRSVAVRRVSYELHARMHERESASCAKSFNRSQYSYDKRAIQTPPRGGNVTRILLLMLRKSQGERRRTAEKFQTASRTIRASDAFSEVFGPLQKKQKAERLDRARPQLQRTTNRARRSA